MSPKQPLQFSTLTKLTLQKVRPFTERRNVNEDFVSVKFFLFDVSFFSSVMVFVWQILTTVFQHFCHPYKFNP